MQIAGVSHSTIQITYEGQRRKVPLEPAVMAVGSNVSSPARLIRARAGVIPYAAREGLLDELDAWANDRRPFAGRLIGGRGGSGKTRLGVALCERAHVAGWLCGLLVAGADQAALEALLDAPTARLVVVDYAESRVEQLDAILAPLAASATERAPVRVLLLVRGSPRTRDGDWRAPLRHHSDALDRVLDDVDVRVLEDMPLAPGERRALFTAAAHALAAHGGDAVSVPAVPEELEQPLFAAPLAVVIAAYLTVHRQASPGEQAGRTPATPGELFDELLAHERRYWKTAAAEGLDCDDVLRQRVVALATLAGASDEAHAVRLLRLVPDLATTSSERLGRLARWAHRLYPGPGWWNALEPDRIGEHLVALTYASADNEHPFLHTGHDPRVLAGVLDSDVPEQLVAPLDLYARAAPEYQLLAQTLTPILSAQLQRLCTIAITQAARHSDLDLLLGEQTLAAALTRTLATITVDDNTLPDTINALPRRPDLILDPLALELTNQAVTLCRRLAKDNPAAYEPALATSLNNLSNRLADVGRRDESLAAIQDAVTICRRLAKDNPAAYEPDLATSLNNLSVQLADAGRRGEALTASQQAVTIRRRLATDNPAAYEPDLATSLSNLSNQLADVGRRGGALTASQQAVTIRRRLATDNPAAYEPDLATSLNNLSNRLADAGRRGEALTASQDAVTICRRLATDNPAAYQPDLATLLNNLSVRLADAGRRDEGLAAIQEAVGVYRRLAQINAAAYEHYLAGSLNNLSVDLADAGHRDEALAAIEEAVTIYRRLAKSNPAAHEPHLAGLLNTLAARLADAERRDEGVAAIQEAVTLYRRLAKSNPAAHEPDLAMSLHNLAVNLADAERRDERLAAIEEAVTIYRRLADISPAAYEPNLALSLTNLSARLADAERRDEADAVRREAASIESRHKRGRASNAD